MIVTTNPTKLSNSILSKNETNVHTAYTINKRLKFKTENTINFDNKLFIFSAYFASFSIRHKTNTSEEKKPLCLHRLAE